VRRSWNVASTKVVAAMVFAVFAAAWSGCSREPASIKELAAERSLADSLVRGYVPGSDSLAFVVTRARTKTAEFLSRHGNDVPAAILFVKLRLAEEALNPPPPVPPDTTGAPPDPFARGVRAKARMVDALQRLDHAIKREPKNAEAHYWKALVHGLWEPIFDKLAIDPRRSQLPQAVAAAQKAVSLQPDSASYRTALATYQMLSGDEKAALRTFREGKDPRNPTLRLLAEWEKFPLPPKAVLSWRESAGIAEWMSQSGLDDANARVRAYWVPGPQDSLRAFYGRRWKRLYWMSQKQRQPNGEEWAFGSAAVVFEGDGYRGALEADIKSNALLSAEGISIQVREVRNPHAASRAAIPFDPGPVVCEMLLTNHRKVR